MQHCVKIHLSVARDKQGARRDPRSTAQPTPYARVLETVWPRACLGLCDRNRYVEVQHCQSSYKCTRGSGQWMQHCVKNDLNVARDKQGARRDPRSTAQPTPHPRALETVWPITCLGACEPNTWYIL
jgi:hypothetical protein